HKLLLEEADKRGITAYHQDQRNQLYAQLTSAAGAKELKAVTGQYDIEADKVAKLAEERLIIDELSQLVVTNMSYITEDELKKHYASKNIDRNPTGVAHVLHIFTTDNDMAQAAAKELAGGIIFSEVARKYSEGPERSNGGDLGYINEADFPEFFSDAFKLKAGETSDVVRSDYGFHIFKVMQYANAERTAYENVKQELYAELYTKKRQEMIREFVNALLNNANIQYLDAFTLDELFPNKGQR
ncbi:MAG: peptidylprolyl isomerase, partial [Deferribacteraceae bacterium]|nr:peptidylprolyl isomerase [Deferribacteraceae bacterium]